MKPLLRLPFLLLFTTLTAGAAEWDNAQPLRWISPGVTANAVGAQPQPDAPQADVLVFDSFTNGSYLATGSSPRTYMGMPFDLNAAAGSNPAISKAVLYLAYTGTAAQTYTRLRARMQLWNTWAIASDPVFSNPAAALYEADVAGPITLQPNTLLGVSMTLASPIPLTGLASHGIVVNFQGDKGAGFETSGDLTALLRYGPTVAVGANALAGSFGYQNLANQTTFNHSPSDARTVQQANEAIALQLYATTTPLIAQGITSFAASPANPLVSDGSFSVSATGGASGNAVVFSIASASAGVCAAAGTNGTTIRILGAGTCSVLANQAGSASHTAAPQQALPVNIDTAAGRIFATSFQLATPRLGKAFAPASVEVGVKSRLTLTLTNPRNALATLSTALTDTLPAGLVVATPPAAATTCASGTASATAGGSTLTLSTGARIAANASCTVSVDVKAAQPGAYTNIVVAGALQTNLGNSPTPAAAVLTVTAPACWPTQLLSDPGLEAGSPNPWWSSTSTMHGTALCDTTCGGVGPRSGTHWAWMGAAGSLREDSTLEQRVTIPAGAPRYLNFYMWVSSTGHPPAFMAVDVDGVNIRMYHESTPAETGYTARTVDLSNYADGGSHLIVFHYSTPGGYGPSHFQIDDVTVDCLPLVP